MSQKEHKVREELMELPVGALIVHNGDVWDVDNILAALDAREDAPLSNYIVLLQGDKGYLEALGSATWCGKGQAE